MIRGGRDDYYRGAYIYARYPPEMRITRSKVTVLSLLIMGTWHNSKLAYFLLRPSKLEMATVEVGCLLRPDSHLQLPSAKCHSRDYSKVEVDLERP